MTTMRRTTAALSGLALLLLPLTGCAPEPGEVGAPEGTVGEMPNSNEKQEPEGGSWPEENPPEVFEKSTELPENFPAEFVTPSDAVIEDAGARGPDTWFVVYRAADTEGSEAIWSSVISENGFTVSDEAETPEGGKAATLSGETLQVTAMTLPQSDGTVQLSYDIMNTL